MSSLRSTLPVTTTGRIRSLDGLRGVAALMVLCSHAMLTNPTFADAILETGRPAALSAAWWLTYTPLHLFWFGTEAVFVFFILSGFVLTAPALHARLSWSAYYRQRLPRLYIPVWGSLIFAAAVVAVFPRQAINGASWWTNGHLPVSGAAVLTDAMLLGPISALNSPLWSLKWEVWFSLLLPAYVAIGLWSKKSLWHAAFCICAVFALMGSFAFTRFDALRYLPIFALGVLLYVHKDEITALSSLADNKSWVWPAVTGAALSLLASFWLIQGSGTVPGNIVSASRLAQVAGAGLLVTVVLCWRSASKIFETRPLQWLGSRSFSLYLIHDPIVSTTAFLLGGTASPFSTLGIAVPTSLVIAEIFFRTVERPSHRLAKRLVARRLQSI